MKIQPDNGYYTLQRPEMARLIRGRPKRILEVGCANGFFKRNIFWTCEYHGIEPVPAVAECAKKEGLIVHVGTYEDTESQLLDGYFDLIVCNDVIEHMADPWQFLGQVRRKLARGGQLMGSVPNVRYCMNLMHLFFKRDWAYEAAGVLDRTHLRFFTQKSLSRLLVDSGLHVDLIRPIGPDRNRFLKMLLHPFFWLIGTDTLYMQIAFSCHIPASGVD